MFSYLKSKNISIKKILLSLVAAFSLMVPLVNYRYMNLTIFAKSFNKLRTNLYSLWHCEK